MAPIFDSLTEPDRYPIRDDITLDQQLRYTIRYLKWLAVNDHVVGLKRLLGGLDVEPLPPGDYLDILLERPGV